MQSSDAMLTIVDLAGAEREKRTGNQVIYFCLHFVYGLVCKAINIYVMPESTGDVDCNS